MAIGMPASRHANTGQESMSCVTGLQSDNTAKAAPAPATAPTGSPAASTKPKAREGKRAIVGHFSEDLSRQLRMLATEENTTVQALVGDRLGMLLRASASIHLASGNGLPLGSMMVRLITAGKKSDINRLYRRESIFVWHQS